jgi:outer membrane protein assembly factor BamB
MNITKPKGVLAVGLLLLSANGLWAQDWPQWRGPNRDNKVVGFTVPATWPKELTKKWTVNVGVGDSSPVLVGDKVYIFARQGGDEVTLCLDAATGNEVWKDKYATQPATPPAGGIHAGPRSTPAVAAGKVCTLGVRGILSCLDAGDGKVVWRKDTKNWPKFFTSSSPLITEGKCIVYLGGQTKGEVAAFDLASGERQWTWTGPGAPYGSPVLMTADGTKQLVTLTAKSLVGLSLDGGKLLWEVPFAGKYNSSTPIVDGQTVICSVAGAGTLALKIEKQGDEFTAKQLWKKNLAANRYNTPMLKDGVLYGLSTSQKFFAMDAKTGDTLWTDPTERGECGAIFDAGPVLLALTTDSELVAFQPSNKGYTEVAKYTVANSATWAYPILAGNRVFVKDKNGALTLWTID